MDPMDYVGVLWRTARKTCRGRCIACKPRPQRGYFHRVLYTGPWRAPHRTARVIWHQTLDRWQTRCNPAREPHATAGDPPPRQGQAPLSIYRCQCPIAKGAAPTRKPGGQCLKACPPGLTADTTVFAIGRHAEMKVHMAGRQGIASRGCLGSCICCTVALNARGGRLHFVRRCLKSTGKWTLPKSRMELKRRSQWRQWARLNFTSAR